MDAVCSLLKQETHQWEFLIIFQLSLWFVYFYYVVVSLNKWVHKDILCSISFVFFVLIYLISQWIYLKYLFSFRFCKKRTRPPPYHNKIFLYHLPYLPLDISISFYFSIPSIGMALRWEYFFCLLFFYIFVWVVFV